MGCDIRSIALRQLYSLCQIRHCAYDQKLYQTDWNISSLVGKVDTLYSFELMVKSVPVLNSSRFWISSLESIPMLSDSQNNLFIVVEDLTGKFQMFDSKQNLLLESELGSKVFINGHILQLQELRPLTGLQIKSDPGINIVYMGFLLLIFSSFLSYISYSQIWAIRKGEKLYLSGRTNRAIYTFEKDFLKLLENII